MKLFCNSGVYQRLITSRERKACFRKVRFQPGVVVYVYNLRLKQKVHKFKSSLNNLVRSCLKIKIKFWVCSSVQIMGSVPRTHIHTHTKSTISALSSRYPFATPSPTEGNWTVSWEELLQPCKGWYSSPTLGIYVSISGANRALLLLLPLLEWLKWFLKANALSLLFSPIPHFLLLGGKHLRLEHSKATVAFLLLDTTPETYNLEEGRFNLALSLGRFST